MIYQSNSIFAKVENPSEKMRGFQSNHSDWSRVKNNPLGIKHLLILQETVCLIDIASYLLDKSRVK